MSASLQYAGDNTFLKVAQMVDIIVIEATLFGIYLSFLNGRITGPSQTTAAGITYLTGFILACFGIVADSQLNAGVPLSLELDFISDGTPYRSGSYGPRGAHDPYPRSPYHEGAQKGRANKRDRRYLI